MGSPAVGLSLVMPPSRRVALNAAIVVEGHVMGGLSQLAVEVHAGDALLPCRMDAWSGSGFNPGHRVSYLIHPAHEWPAGATLNVTARSGGIDERFTVRIGTARDTTAPTLDGDFGPPRLERLEMPMIGARTYVRIACGAIEDVESARIRVELMLQGPGRRGTLRQWTAIYDGMSPPGDFLIDCMGNPDELLAVTSATLTDTAGNVAQYPRDGSGPAGRMRRGGAG